MQFSTPAGPPFWSLSAIESDKSDAQERRPGIPIASTLGRHTNDRMTSFYAVTPSGFQIEYGRGGVKIDDTTWDVRTYDASTWGHRTPAGT